MPVTVEFENDGMGVVIKASGEMSGNDMYEANKALYQADVIAKLRYQIVDLSDVHSVDTTPEHIQELAEQDNDAARQNPNMRIAIVANNDLLHSLGRMWQSYTKGSDVQGAVFNSMERARAWVKAHLAADRDAG